MSYLELAGVQLRALDGRSSQQLGNPARRSRSWRGFMRDARRNIRRSWQFEGKFLDYGEAESLQHILNGEGHMFDFEDGLQSWTGLNPMPGYKTRLYAGAANKAGNPSGTMGPGDGIGNGDIFMQYDAQLPSEWTLVWWETVGASSSTWIQVAIRSDGQGWLGGVEDLTVGRPGDSNKFGLEVVDGFVNIYLNDNTTPRMDDLVILPYKAYSNHITAWATQDDVKFSPLPALRVTGDFCNEDYVLCLGEVTGSSYLQKPADEGGAWVNNSQTIRFKLHEIKPGFLLDDTFEETQADVTIPNNPGVVAPIPNFVENP